MLRAAGVRRDEGQVDFRLRRRGQLFLGLLRRLLQALEGHLVLAQIDALLLAELVGEPVDDALVEVVAAEVGVAIGGLHLEDAIAQLQHGDVKGAAAEVVDGDALVLLLVEAVGQRGRRRLVDDAQHLQPGDASGVAGGLALGVVEVGGDGDDGLLDVLAQVRLGVGAQLLQDHRADFRRAVLLAHHLDPGVAIGGLHHLVGDEALLAVHIGIVELAAHEALDRVDGIFRVGDGLALGDFADQTLTALGEGDDGWRRAGAFRVRDDDRLATLHDGDTAIGGSKINADDFGHLDSPQVLFCVGRSGERRLVWARRVAR